MQRRIWGAALLASLGWGTGTVVTRLALRDGASPYEIAMVRGILAGLAVIVFMVARRGLRRPGKPAVAVGVVMAVTNMAIPFVLTSVAVQYASAGFVALPSALIPLTTAAMAHLFLPAERLTWIKTAGLTLALAGVAVLVLAGDSGLEEGGRPLLAGLLGLVSVVSISAGSIVAKHFAGRHGVLEVSGIQFALGAVLIAGASLVFSGSVGAGPTAAWPELGYLAVAATFIPFLMYYWLIRHVTATYAAAVGYVVPLIAVVAGVIVLGEQIQPGIAVGGALIMAGVVLTDRLEHRKTALDYR
ncbi:MAG: DMT family transporter [Actinobacteria bacterium]|nr:DMT family transporter [Actinomycetota bacterium]MBU1492465.1 DMT family transporter [Actinomycetota bacterium]